MGNATGQFGKNHLGDKDEFLPTHATVSMNFIGNLYHLNAEEGAGRSPITPKNPAYRKQFGPTGVLRCTVQMRDWNAEKIRRHRFH
jgi:arylsulfatase